MSRPPENRSYSRERRGSVVPLFVAALILATVLGSCVVLPDLDDGPLGTLPSFLGLPG